MCKQLSIALSDETRAETLRNHDDHDEDRGEFCCGRCKMAGINKPLAPGIILPSGLDRTEEIDHTDIFRTIRTPLVASPATAGSAETSRT